MSINKSHYPIENVPEDRFSNLKIISISAFLGIVAALRFQTGTDWTQYVDLFNRINPDSIDNSLYTYIQSPGFVFFQFLIKQFSDDVRVFFFVCSFITTFCFLLAIRKFQAKLPIAIFMYFFLGFYVLSFNAVRQSMAVAIFFLAMSIKPESLKKYIALIFLASFFHSSALLVGALVFIIERIRINKKNIILILSSSFIFYSLLQTSLVKNFVSIFDSRYENHLELEAAGTGTLLHLMFKLILILLLIYLEKDKSDKEFSIYLIFACITLFFATTSWTIGRLEPYFSIFFTVIVSRVLGKESNRSFLAVVYLATALFFGFYVSFYNGVIPYKTLFTSSM
jgi:transmembrane protein EpsG